MNKSNNLQNQNIAPIRAHKNAFFKFTGLFSIYSLIYAWRNMPNIFISVS